MSESKHSTTSYCTSWENDFDFIKPASDKYSALCTFCNKIIKIDKSGIAQIKIHARGDKHKAAANVFSGRKRQQTFTMSGKGTIQLPNTILLTEENKVLRAEILQALKYVNCNYSFSSATEDTEILREQFPDSKIVKSYQMSETKMKYVIQFGISPYIREENIRDLRNSPYSFKFDETTTSQVKKQYDGYAQFWSEKENNIVSVYCGSLFTGHCTSEQLLEHFFKLIDQMQLSSHLLIHIGMDGPNVNKAFQDMLKGHCGNKQTTIVDIGTCTLHKVHNAFRQGLTVLGFDIDKLVIDISSYFKLSAARREDYEMMETFTDITPRVALRHVTSRWLSLRKVCLRILEQYPNLKQYFLVYLPEQKSFKREIENTPRYQRIVKALTDPIAQVYISFVAYAATDFERYLTAHQTSEPMIHNMHDNMIKLMSNVTQKFMKASHVNSKSDFSSMNFSKHLKHLNKVDIGTRALVLLCENNVSEKEKHDVQSNCLKFFVKAAGYLQAQLPITNEIIKDARALHSHNRLESWSLKAISRLALTIAPSMSKEMHRVFSVNENLTNEDICDIIRCQWREYQTEDIPKEWHRTSMTDKHQSRRNQHSYWKEVETQWCEIDKKDENETLVPIDEYWACVFQIQNENGRAKFPQLAALVKCVLSLSHGNSGPEKGFSRNKAILQAHGSSLNEDTLVALRNVRDKLIVSGKVTKFIITNELLQSVKNSRQRYHNDLESKRRLAEAESQQSTLNKDKNKIERQKKSGLSEIDERIMSKEEGIRVADEAMSDGNKKLQAALSAKPLSSQKLQAASSQIEMGAERKRKLQQEIGLLKKQRLELDKQ